MAAISTFFFDVARRGTAMSNRLQRRDPAVPVATRGVVDVADAAAVQAELDGIVHILTCGSVDDGKSTLIGRLLWDASDLHEDQRATLRRSAQAAGDAEDIDYSLLLDGLMAEREQGITIDIAWRYFDADRRRFVVIDSPGHEQYTRNMASGASHADVAVVLVDARVGIKPQTRRHAAILDMVGVRHVVLAVNKMDLVDGSQNRFEAIAAEFQALCRNFGFHEPVAIPVSARRGDNVAQRSAAMPWYHGPTLVEQLGRTPNRRTSADGAFRFPVQSVVRGERDFRGLAGLVTSGSARVGDVVRDAVTGRESRIKRIVTMDGDLEAASAGRSVVLQLASDIDVGRGNKLG